MMQDALQQALEALTPIAQFEALRAQMGGNAPHTGGVLTVNAKGESAELTVEHLRAAQSAMAIVNKAMEQHRREAAKMANSVGTGRRGRPAMISDLQVITMGEQLEAAGKRVTGYTLRAALGGVGRTDRYNAVWERHIATRGPKPASSPSQPAAAFQGDPLAAIGHLIATQDNRITDAPIFAVQQKRRIHGIDPDWSDNAAWLDDEGNEAADEDREKLEAHWKEHRLVMQGWKRVGYIDIWEFVTACFTEQGCKNFLAINGHNLKEPRIYAYGSYRNAEWRCVRDALLSLHKQASNAEGSPQ